MDYSSERVQTIEEESLAHARKLWDALVEMSCGDTDKSLKWRHLFHILHLGTLLHLSPAGDSPKSRADVMCLAVTDDGCKLRSVSSRLRQNLRLRMFEKEEASKVKEESRIYKIKKEVWQSDVADSAFEGRNVKILERAKTDGRELPAQEPNKNHRFDKCAEVAVYNKVVRGMDSSVQPKPFTMYTVQKKFDGVRFRVRVVKRCDNCRLLFGDDQRICSVVTDHEKLSKLEVPLLTPRVLKFIREQLDQSTYKQEMLRSHPIFETIWIRGVVGNGRRDSVVLPILGSPNLVVIQDEIATQLRLK